MVVTRRVRQRTFLLRPSKIVTQVVGYVFAVMQQRWNIDLHALIAMSNHLHEACTDPDGSIVEFTRDVHDFIARAINAHHGEFEAVWSSTQTSRVEVDGPTDLLGKIGYVLANPVEAGLVRHGHSWPGLRMAWPQKPRVFKRPAKFFRGPKDGGNWPDEATLVMTRPPEFDHLSDDELAAKIKAAADALEQKARDKHDAEQRPFLGRRQVKAQSRHARPNTREPRFGLSPKVACKDKWRRIARLRHNRQWLIDYETALARWRAGERDVVFPPGTYKMRKVHGVCCAAPPT